MIIRGKGIGSCAVLGRITTGLSIIVRAWLTARGLEESASREQRRRSHFEKVAA